MRQLIVAQVPDLRVPNSKAEIGHWQVGDLPHSHVKLGLA